MPLPPPPVPCLMPSVAASCMIPTHRARLWGGAYSYPPKEKTCFRKVSGGGGGGGGGYLTPESLSCTARGGAQSESGGWCASTPTPRIPPLVIPPTWITVQRKPCRVWGMVWEEFPSTEVPS